MIEQQLEASILIKLLKNGHIVEFTVGGYSMFPFLLPGGRIKVKPVEINTLKIGNLVVFQNGGRLILHRLLYVSQIEGEFVLKTKGDSTWRADPPVKSDNYLGKAVFYERKRIRRNFEQPFSINSQKIIALFNRFTPIIFLIYKIFRKIFRIIGRNKKPKL